MMEWWQAREPRERMALLVALAVILATLGYSLLWRPLNEDLARQRHRAEVQRETLAWMQQAAQQVKALQRQPQSRRASSRSLLSEAERAAAQTGLKGRLKQLNPEGRDKLRVTVQDAAFDDFIQWLGRLQQAGITASSLTLSRIDDGPTIQARLLLERRR